MQRYRGTEARDQGGKWNVVLDHRNIVMFGMKLDEMRPQKLFQVKSLRNRLYFIRIVRFKVNLLKLNF